jgi:hypothetical protein
MAVRDPGTPGRNPLFGAGPSPQDAPREDPYGAADEPPWGYARPDVDAVGTLVGLLDALTQAQPEAAEHLVAAAHEVVLAVKTVVDAAESALAQQRAGMQVPREEPWGGDPSGSGVHRIDLG